MGEVLYLEGSPFSHPLSHSHSELSFSKQWAQKNNGCRWNRSRLRVVCIWICWKFFTEETSHLWMFLWVFFPPSICLVFASTDSGHTVMSMSRLVVGLTLSWEGKLKQDSFYSLLYFSASPSKKSARFSENSLYCFKWPYCWNSEAICLQHAPVNTLFAYLVSFSFLALHRCRFFSRFNMKLSRNPFLTFLFITPCCNFSNSCLWCLYMSDLVHPSPYGSNIHLFCMNFLCTPSLWEGLPVGLWWQWNISRQFLIQNRPRRVFLCFIVQSD